MKTYGLLDKRLKPRDVLLAFNRIQSEGEHVAGAFVYQGLKAFTSYDGYTCVITDERVSIYIYFHNKCKLEFKQREDVSPFVKKLNAVMDEV